MTTTLVQDATTAVTLDQARRREFVVLLVISGGLILILLTVVVAGAGWFPHSDPPAWAHDVLVAIGTAAILKLGDCLNALVQLASGRQVMQLGDKLAASTPAEKATAAPKSAQDAADEMLNAANDKHDEIVGDPQSPEKKP